MKIPTKFYKGDNQPTAQNVGELKAALAELPDDLPVKSGYGKACLIVFNYGTNDQHLKISEEY